MMIRSSCRPLTYHSRCLILPSITPPFIPKPNHKNFSTSPQDFITILTTSMETIHTYSGIPWWALIPITSITLRSIWTLPLAILQRKRVQKQSSLRPIINSMGPILRLKLAQRAQTSKIKESQSGVAEKEGIPQGAITGKASGLSYEQIMLLSVKERRSRQKKLFKENNCQIYKNLILPIFQIPLWISMSLTFRQISGFDNNGGGALKDLDPSLFNEGILWFTDLSVSDPYFVLPIVLGVSALSNVEWNFKNFQLQNNTSVKRSKRITAFDSVINLSRLGVVFLMAISTQAPSSLVLYWISSNMFSTLQNIGLDYFLPVSYTPESRIRYKSANKGSIPLFTRNV